MIGYVYILTNKGCPGVIKIGFTNRSPKERLNSINSATGIIHKFDLYHHFETEDAQEIQSLIHKKLSEYRLISNKEFFNLPPNLAKLKIEQIIAGCYKKTTYSEENFALITSTKELGKIVRAHRKKAGITQADLAGLANTGNRFIVDLENGKETMQLGLALKVLNFLRIRIGIDHAK